MADIYNQVILNWVDMNNKTARSFYATQNQDPGAAADYAAFATLAQACCEARITAVQFQQTYVIGGTASEGPYATVWDRAVFGGNNLVTRAYQKNSLVGPKAGIFLPDTITVDLTNPLVTDFQAALEAAMGDSVGNPCGPFKKGWRFKASGG